MDFVTKENVREKTAQKLGLRQNSVLDKISRSDFASDDAFLDAAAKMELERSSPEYREVRRRLEREYEARWEHDEKEQNSKRYQELRSTAKLSSLDTQEVDTEATERARRDLAAGRIRASELAPMIESYAKDLTEKRKDTIASNAMMNELLRQSINRNSVK